ncbi:MAG: alpha/beta fold hydrolase [Bryobacteraceae bacterium]
MRRLSVLLLCLAAAGLAAQAEVHVELAGRDVAVWKPTAAPTAHGYPLILFSHGFAGCNTQSKFLMQALADAGYLVAAPNHADAHCSPRREGYRMWRYLNLRAEKSFQQPQSWSDTTYHSRLEDAQRTLDAAVAGHLVEGAPVDPSRIGIAGHSLGGYTALGLAGAWPSWKDRRVQAVLAMSPYATPFLASGDLGAVRIPVMYQGGTIDWSITPSVRKADGVYDQTGGPKYYVELLRAGHLTWTNIGLPFHPTISRYAVAFFDRYLKGESDDALAALTSAPWSSHVSDVRVHLE